MGKVIYSMSVSLDGYIAGPDGTFDWSVPDDELHRFHNERVRELGGHLLGRRLYETMRFWDTALEDPDLGDTMSEFAAIWQPLPKVVFSRTLTAVEGNATLADAPLTEVLAELRERDRGDIGIGGAGLAAEALAAGLVDELEPFVYPVMTGGGTPFLPPLPELLPLELLETRTFGGRVQHLRYAVRR